MTVDPTAEYRSRVARLEDLVAAQERRSKALSRARGLTFAGGLGCLAVTVFTASDPGVVAPSAGAMLFASFGLLALVHDRAIQRVRRLALHVELNRQALDRLDRRWDLLPLQEVPEPLRSSATARDLGLVGRASLMHLLGTAASPPGRQTLARWLAEPAPPAEVVRRQRVIAGLAPRLDLRQELEARGRAWGASEREVTGFVAWAEGPPAVAHPERLRWLGRLWPLLSVGLLGASVAGLVPFSVWLLLVVAAAGLGGRLRSRAHDSFVRVGLGARALGDLERVLDLVESTAVAGHGPVAAAGLPGRLELGRLRQAVARSELRRSMLHGPVDALVLWDLGVLLEMERWRRRCGGRVRRWLEVVGEVEACAALGGLVFDNPSWAMPEVTAGVSGLEARELGHPLIADRERVANDVTVGPAGTLLLVTGSNMSGKSTLVRALGLNAVLAQAGGPVCARFMVLPPVEVLTTILVEDSLERGVSRFLAELERLKAMVETAEGLAAGGDRRPLVLLDEVLTSTNAVERRQALRTILERLVGAGALGAVTTHDLELGLDGSLAAVLRPVHFREAVEIIEDGPAMSFDYRLRTGLAPTTNALVLLRLMGL